MTGTWGRAIGITWLLAALASLAVATGAQASAFLPDPSFGTGGTVDLLAVNQPGGTVYRAREVRPGREGTAFVHYRALSTPEQSECESQSYISRYLADGQVDTSFGVAGFTAISPPVGCRYPSLYVDRQSRPLVVWGSDGGSRGPSTLAIVRYTPRGAPDPTFGDGGVSLLSIPCPGGNGAQPSADAGGNLFLSFGCWADESSPEAMSASPYRSYLARLRADGTLDSGFGEGGLPAAPEEPGWGSAYVAAVEADGSAILAQSTPEAAGVPRRSRLLRLLPDGTLDGEYQSRAEASLRRIAALASPRVPELMTDFLFRRNGDLVVSGGSDRGGWIATLRPDGSLQRKFSGDGFRRFSKRVEYVAADRHGRLFVLARESIRWSIFRLLADGNRDRSIGGREGQWLPRRNNASLLDLVSLWHGSPLLYFENFSACSGLQDCAEPAELQRLRPPT